MGSFSIWHWLVVLAVILVLFGGGNKISGLMGDFAKGIKSFKKNMAEPEDASMEESDLQAQRIVGRTWCARPRRLTASLPQHTDYNTEHSVFSASAPLAPQPSVI